MKIGELAKKTGCKVVTIRYYEKEGLLKEPERSNGNYRLYGQADLERLEFVMHCRRHGMTLGEIKKLLTFRENPQPDCNWVGDLIERHIKSVNEQIASLEHLKLHLDKLRHSCSGEHGNGSCGIIQVLDGSGIHCESCGRNMGIKPGL